MVAIGLTAKEFLRWKRDGINTHIFNPSSFPLAVVSVALLLADATDMTWGFSVAQTEFYPPHIYLALFLIALPGQFLFGVTPMTMAAVTTTFVFSQLYYAATGSYFFVDSHVPIAVFIGMNLLFTDPATSPRTLFGAHLVRRALRPHHRSPVRLVARHEPPRLLRQAAAGAAAQPVGDRAGPAREIAAAEGARSVGVGHAIGCRERRHLAYMSVWALAFGAMSASGYLGDEHPGQWTPFWDKACAANKREACLNLYFLHDGFCEDGSAVVVQRDRDHARRALRQSPRALPRRSGARARCNSPPPATTRPRSRPAGRLRHDAPTALDYRFILRGSKGPIEDQRPPRLYARACELGWPDTCGRT